MCFNSIDMPQIAYSNDKVTQYAVIKGKFKINFNFLYIYYADTKFHVTIRSIKVR